MRVVIQRVLRAEVRSGDEFAEIGPGPFVLHAGDGADEVPDADRGDAKSQRGIPSKSKAPHFTSASTTFLLILRVSTRDAKSKSVLNGPPSWRAARMASAPSGPRSAMRVKCFMSASKNGIRGETPGWR